MTEQNRDATDAVESAVKACIRRLNLLEDAWKRGVHTNAEYERLREDIIVETEEAWGVDLEPLR